MNTEYSRTMYPLEILACQSVANAGLSEKIMHHMMAQYRVHERHELFDLRNAPDDIVDKVTETLRDVDSMSGLQTPTDSPATSAEYVMQLENAKKLKQELKEFRLAKKRQERDQEQKKDTEKKDQERKREADETAREKAERAKLHDAEIVAKIEQFIKANCRVAPDQRIPSTDFLAAVCKSLVISVNATEMHRYMTQLGFEKKSAKPPRSRVPTQCFMGINVKPVESAEEYL